LAIGYSLWFFTESSCFILAWKKTEEVSMTTFNIAARVC